MMELALLFMGVFLLGVIVTIVVMIWCTDVRDDIEMLKRWHNDLQQKVDENDRKIRKRVGRMDGSEVSIP